MSAPPPMPPAQPLAGPEFLPYDLASAQTPPRRFPSPLTDGPTVVPVTRPKRWRWLPHSLSGKLVAGVVSLVVVLVLVTGAATYFAMRSFLTDRLDQQLSSVEGNSFQITRLFNGDPDSYSGVSAPELIWLVALHTDGTLFAEPSLSPPVQAMLLTSSERESLVKRTAGSPTTITTTDGQQLRVTVVHAEDTLTNGTTANVVVIIGLSTGDVARTLHQIVKLELLIGALAVLLALVATSYGVSFSLRRLRRVTTTAQEVAAELSPDGAGLDRRVPVTEEGSEVGQLAESMNTLLSAVETQFAARLESEQRMRQFLADASHELRTPLTSIRGYAELARMQRAAGNADEDNLGRIEAEGTRMSRLVEDLLMLARSDQDSVPRVELVDVAELLDDTVSSARAAFPERSIVLEPTPSYHIVGDPDQLLRVIRNLITNAVVHTEPGPPIRVHGIIDGPGMAIQVIDSGPGLAPDEAAHVFERFWRADKARTRARGGSGLGLSIVASIVEAHGGAVHFQSSVEQGSTVTVWLPGVTA